MVFIHKDGSEIDRIIGFIEAEGYAERLTDIIAGINTIPDLEKQRLENPRDLSVLSSLAEKYQNAMNAVQAREVFETILNQFSDSSDEAVNQARFFLAMQDFFSGDRSAIDYFIQKYPQSDFVFAAYDEMVRFYRANQQQNEEVNVLNAMAARFPDDPGVLNQYAWRMTELSLNLEEALELARKAVRLTAGDSQTQANIIDTEAEVLWKLNRSDEAVTAIQRAIDLDPENGYFQSQLAKFSKPETTE